MTRDAPPRWTVRLLERVLPPEVAGALVGDLLEEYALRARSAHPISVKQWYWAQLIGSAAPLVCAAVARGRWLLPVAVGFAAYAVVDATKVAADAAVATLPEVHRVTGTVLVLIASLVTILLTSYVAARFRPGAMAVLAVLIAVGAARLLVTPGGMPLWYGSILLIAGPLAATAGGALSARRKGRAAFGTTRTT